MIFIHKKPPRLVQTTPAVQARRSLNENVKLVQSSTGGGGLIAPQENKLELKEGSVHRIPYPDNHFNHIISINTVYFWEDVPDAFAEVRRVLKPGGTFVLSIREKETLKKIKATKYGFHFYETEDLIDALETTGFTVILHKKKDYLPFLCIEGEKEQALN